MDCIADDLRILHSENRKDTQVVSDNIGGISILIERIHKLKDFKRIPQEIKLKRFTLILGTDIDKLNRQEKAIIQTLIKKGEMTWKKLTYLFCPYMLYDRFIRINKQASPVLDTFFK